MTKFCKEVPNSIKTIYELYKFGKGIQFNGDDHLRVYVVNSDVDINPKHVEFNINLDRWENN